MSYTNRNRPRKPDEVYDDQGRQRFHGAFTGGFSAGYFNTVGSKEGWTPRAGFVSRREDAVQAKSGDDNDTFKMKKKSSRVPTQDIHDFMDDEDALDTRISSRYVGISTGTSVSGRDKLVQLIQVDDRIGSKLLRMASTARHKARSVEFDNYIEDGSAHDESVAVVIPLESNRNCRGLGYVPDETLRKAKEAKLQSFYQPDDEYDIYDGGMNSKVELNHDYEREIIDHKHEFDDEHDAREINHNAFIAGLDAYTSVNDDPQRSSVLSGFHLGSEEVALMTRYPGPNVPADFCSDKEFPIELKDDEIKLVNDQKNRHDSRITKKSYNLPSSKPAEISTQAQFAKVAEAMRNRFTSSAKSDSQNKGDESKTTSTPFVEKREIFIFQPSRLLCKRLNIGYVEKANNTLNKSSSRETSALDDAISEVVATHTPISNRDSDKVQDEIPIKRPPLDLFQSIFAPDSESDESVMELEEDEMKTKSITPTLTIGDNLGRIPEDKPNKTDSSTSKLDPSNISSRDDNDLSSQSSISVSSRHRKKKRKSRKSSDHKKRKRSKKSYEKDRSRRSSRRDKRERKRSTYKKSSDK